MNKIERSLKILMLSPYFPWPLHGGGGIRIYHILKELSRRGHRVVLLAGREEPVLPPGNPLNSLCEEIHLYQRPSRGQLSFLLRSFFSSLPYPALKFQSDSLQKILHRLLHSQRFDLIWVNLEIMAYALSPDIVKGIPVVLDEHESEELVWRGYLQQGNWWQRLFALINLVKLKKLKQRVLPILNAVFCVSEREATLMRGRAPRELEIWTVPNGVDMEFFRSVPLSQKESNGILLCGSMNIRRNSEAAVWFVKEVFPNIRQMAPDVQLWIVGSSPTREVRELQKVSGVWVTGTVEDVRPHYVKAKVAVAPYRFGAGTKIKVLEAMASGVPVVSTKIGCRGIKAVDGEHLLIADNEDDFADRVTELLTDSKKRQKLALAARKLVEEKYQWKKIVDELEPKLQKLVYVQQKG